MSILFPFLGEACPACERRLDTAAAIREEIDKALTGFRPIEAGPWSSKVFVAWCGALLDEQASKIISEADQMAFESVDKTLPFVPDALDNFLIGRVLGIEAKDTNDKARYLLVQTSKVDENGKRERITFRVPDAATVRAFEKRLGGPAAAKNFDPKRRDEFVLLELDGFVGDNRWPDYKVAFTGTMKDMEEELAKRDGVAFKLTPRVNPNAGKSNSGGGNGGGGGASAPSGGASTFDNADVPF